MNDQNTVSEARELIGNSPLCHLASIDADGYPHSRPMFTLSLDGDMTVYFATGRSAPKCSEIEANPKLCISYNVNQDDMANWQHVHIKGDAVVSTDPELKRRLWQDMMIEYFSDGPNDPNYALIVVKPKELSFTKGEAGSPVRVRF